MGKLYQRPFWKAAKASKGRGPRRVLIMSAPTVGVTQGLLFLISPIFVCHKVKDGGYNNTNMDRVSRTQNTPALRTSLRAKIVLDNVSGIRVVLTVSTKIRISTIKIRF